MLIDTFHRPQSFSGSESALYCGLNGWRHFLMISDSPIEEDRQEEQEEPVASAADQDNDKVTPPSSTEGDKAPRDGSESELEPKDSISRNEKENDKGDHVDIDTKEAIPGGNELKEYGSEINLDSDDMQTTIITESGLKIRPDLYDSETYTMDDYEKMAKLYDETFANIAGGEVVQGTVMKIQGNSVILDVGFKSEGSVSLEEFGDPDEVSVGDKVDVYLENLEDQEGVIVFSKKKADFLKVWDTIKNSFDSDQPIEGVISRKIKGGMVVNVLGVDAFLPGSQIDLRRVNDLDSMIGETHLFKIIKLNKRRRNVVVSRRIILEQERESQRKKLLDEIEVGQVREGEVKNITDFGAFIDLGGVDGLLHITDMSWGRISHPSELVTIGDNLEIKILDIDIERGRISLGLKQLHPYPWENIEKKYPVGEKIRGKVVSLTNYGAFIELEKGVEGLVHVSEMSWTRHIRHPSKILAIGDIVEAVVLSVDAEAEKISLGIKQVEADPWLSLTEKYPTGTIIDGKVRNLTSFGAFVEIEEGIDGLVHVSDMSWTKRVMHPSEVLKKGEKVSVVILNIDTENRRISLGLKQVQDDPWEALSTEYSEGTETTGEIARILDKGLVVDLGNDVEGFIPISQVTRKSTRPLEQEFNTGDILALRVIECDQENRRIVLSAESVIKAAEVKSPAPEETVPPEDVQISEAETIPQIDQEGAGEDVASEDEVKEEIAEPKAVDEVVEEPGVITEEISDSVETDSQEVAGGEEPVPGTDEEEPSSDPGEEELSSNREEDEEDAEKS